MSSRRKIEKMQRRIERNIGKQNPDGEVAAAMASVYRDLQAKKIMLK